MTDATSPGGSTPGYHAIRKVVLLWLEEAVDARERDAWDREFALERAVNDLIRLKRDECESVLADAADQHGGYVLRLIAREALSRLKDTQIQF
jgi:cytochrome P450